MLNDSVTFNVIRKSADRGYFVTIKVFNITCKHEVCRTNVNGGGTKNDTYLGFPCRSDGNFGSSVRSNPSAYPTRSTVDNIGYRLVINIGINGTVDSFSGNRVNSGSSLVFEHHGDTIPP